MPPSVAAASSGDRTTDTTGSTVYSEQYDGHGRLATFKNGATTEGTYSYDGYSRLVQRVVSSVSPSGTTQYLYDPDGHVILETDQNGNTLREYIWLDDMPVGIIDQVNTTTPVLYFVHADHLDRPVMVTNTAGASVWKAVWTPFGAPYSITSSLTYNARFPGQWFQIESGLNYNWFRHYDPSVGGYVQSDPIGLGALLSEGPSTYAYVGGQPTDTADPSGLCPVERCKQLKKQILEKADALQDELRKYNPELDGIGGWPTAGGGVTKPGGHYEEISNLRRGIKNDILRYFLLGCSDEDDPDNTGPLPRWIDPMANRPVEPPVYQGTPYTSTLISPSPYKLIPLLLEIGAAVLAF